MSAVFKATLLGVEALLAPARCFDCGQSPHICACHDDGSDLDRCDECAALGTHCADCLADMPKEGETGYQYALRLCGDER